MKIEKSDLQKLYKVWKSRPYEQFVDFVCECNSKPIFISNGIDLFSDENLESTISQLSEYVGVKQLEELNKPVTAHNIKKKDLKILWNKMKDWNAKQLLDFIMDGHHTPYYSSDGVDLLEIQNVDITLRKVFEYSLTLENNKSSLKI